MRLRRGHASRITIVILFLITGVGWAGEADDLAKATDLLKRSVELYEQGRYAQGIPLAKEALEIRKKVLGEECAETAEAYYQLGKLLCKQGQYAQAEPMLARALDIRRKIFPEESLAMAESYNSLAELYLTAGRYAEALPLVLRALEIRTKLLGVGHPDSIESLANLGAYYYYIRDYDKAEPLFNKALEICHKTLGEEHPDTAISYNNLAILLQNTGRYAEAEPLYIKSLKIRRKVLGEEHRYTVDSYNNLALLYQITGQYEKAEPLYIEVLEIRRKTLGEEHPDTVTSYNNLAFLYDSNGRYAKAEPLYKKALEIRRKALGEEHPDTAASYNNLAVFYYSTGRYAEAKPLYIKALDIRCKSLGEEHPDTAASYNNLAVLYKETGRYAEAEPLYKKALEIYRKALGDEHPEIATSYNNLAKLYETTGRYAEAEPLCKKALEIRRKALGDEQPATAASYNTIAMLYFSTGRYAKAEPLFIKALEIRRKALGEEHPDTAVSYHNLAFLYQATGRYAEAEPLYNKALEIHCKALGEKHPDTATCYNNLAGLYEATGRYAEAEPFYIKALEIRRKALGEDHRYTAASYNNLAFLYDSNGRYAEAEPLYKKALESFQISLGDEHPDTATLYNNLAALYKATARYAAAEPLYKKAMEIRRNALGDEHPDTANSYNNLAELYKDTGRYAEAEPLYKKALEIRRKALGEEDPGTAIFHLNLGIMNWSLGRNEETERHFDTAFSSLSRFIVHNLNAGQTGEGMKLLQLQVSNFSGMISYNLAMRPADQAYNLVAYYKGLFFDAAAAARAELLKDPRSKALFQQFRGANGQLSALVNLRLKATDPTIQKNLEEQITPQTAKVKELERQLSDASAAYRQNKEAWGADNTTVRKALSAGAVLVDIFRYQRYEPRPTEGKKQWQEHRYAAFVVDQKGVKYFDLGPADAIDAQVTELRALLDSEYIRQHPNYWDEETLYKQKAVELYRKVFQPYEKELAGYSLVLISPDGLLSTIPFQILVDDQSRYLVERYAFGYETSARELIRAAQKTGAGQGALLVGDPDYDLGNGKTTQVAQGQVQFTPGRDFVTCGSASDVGVLNFGRLEASGEAARTVGQSLKRASGGGKVEVVTGAAATESFIKQNAPGRQYLFFATHGYFIEKPPAETRKPLGSTDLASKRAVINPLSLCGLALAGANTTTGAQESKDDGLLTGQEVAGLDLSGVKLVVLAACTTGLGEVKNGQGLMGLRYAFTLAGAQTVAAASWNIPLDETQALMEQWAPQVMAGQPAASQLQKAQLSLMESMRQKHGTTHPYFWGAFTCSGKVW